MRSIRGRSSTPRDGRRAPCEVELTVGGRRLRARRRGLPDGWAAWYVDDVTEQHARLDNLLAERSRSRFLASASRRLGLSLHPGRTARTVVELAAAELAHAVAVVWPSLTGADVVEWAAGERARRGALRPRRAGELPGRWRPRCAARRVTPAAARRPGRRAVGGDRAVDAVAGPVRGSTAAVGAVVSLPGNGVPAGALVLLRDARGAGAAAPARDTALVEEFAQRAGIAMAAAALYARQVRTAGVLRSSLVQPPLPQVPGLTLGAAYRPADEGLLIGGDFYDVLHRPGTATTFLLGDVCGKGVDAAVSTGRVRQSVVALGRRGERPGAAAGDAQRHDARTDPARPCSAVRDAGARYRDAPAGRRRPPGARRRRPPPAAGGARRPGRAGGHRRHAGRRGARRAFPGLHRRPRSGGVVRALQRRGHRGARRASTAGRSSGRSASPRSWPAATCCPPRGSRSASRSTSIAVAAPGYHDDIAVLVVQAPIPVHRPAGRHLHSVHDLSAHRRPVAPEEISRRLRRLTPFHPEEVP